MITYVFFVEVYFPFCCLILDVGLKFQRFSITENIISWSQAFTVLHNDPPYKEYITKNI